MHRDSAYAFLQGKAAFDRLELKITDIDSIENRVELQFSSGDKVWLDMWEAAKVIEALS